MSDEEFFEEQSSFNDKENQPYQMDSSYADQQSNSKKSSFKPELTNIPEERAGDVSVFSFSSQFQPVQKNPIDLFNEDWKNNKERSLLRLPDSFQASPGSYHFSSPSSIDESSARHAISHQSRPHDSFAVPLASRQDVSLCHNVSESTPKKANLSSFRDEYNKRSFQDPDVRDSFRSMTVSRAPIPALATSPKKTHLSRIQQKTFADSPPTFILDATRSGKGSKALETDRLVVYFGFQPVGSECEDFLTITNVSENTMTLRYVIYPESANQNFKFVVPPTVKLHPGKKSYVRLLFLPSKAVRYRAWLRVEVDGEPDSHPMPLMGFGGRADVHPIASDDGKRTVMLSSTGIIQLFPRSTNCFKFCLQNDGARDAFVFVIVQDNNGDEFPAEKVIIRPAHFVLHKGGTIQGINVRLFGASPALENGAYIASSQRSLETISSRPPSVNSSVSSVAQAVSPAFRILICYGEERQRLRLKQFESHQRYSESTQVLGRCLSWGIDGEKPLDGEKEAYLSLEDRRHCLYSIRYHMLQVFERKRNVGSRNTSMRYGHGHTLIEIKPDDTLKACESLFDSTLTK